MEFGVADMASLASPDPMSLAMNSVKMAVKVHGIYSARGGKLAEFARCLSKRLQCLPVPLHRQLDQCSCTWKRLSSGCCTSDALICSQDAIAARPHIVTGACACLLPIMLELCRY